MITGKLIVMRNNSKGMKRRAFALVGAIMILFGAVWFLQGAGVLPGSVMSGSQFWEMAGAVTVVVGLVIVDYCLRTSNRSSLT